MLIVICLIYKVLVRDLQSFKGICLLKRVGVHRELVFNEVCSLSLSRFVVGVVKFLVELGVMEFH